MNGHTLQNVKDFVDTSTMQFSSEEILELEHILWFNSLKLTSYLNNQSLTTSSKLEGIITILLDPTPLKAQNDHISTTAQIRRLIYKAISKKIEQTEAEEQQKLAESESRSITSRLFNGLTEMIIFFNYRNMTDLYEDNQQDNHNHPHFNHD